MDSTITSADGTDLEARSTGRGSPLVLVGGANSDIDTFRLVEPLLAEHHTVWVYSRRGHGNSGDGPDYCLDREVEDVLAVLDAAGDGAHLLGVSGGAMYVLLAAARTASLRSVVVYEPPLAMTDVHPTVIEDLAAMIDSDPARGLDLFAQLAGMAEDLPVLRSIPEVWERVLRGARRLPRELRTAVAERDRECPPPRVPTLYLYGEETRSPAFLEPHQVGLALPGAALHGIPGQRHLAFAFAPALFAAAVLEFTSSIDADPRAHLERTEAHGSTSTLVTRT